MPKPGRPPLYTDEQRLLVLSYRAQGDSVRKIAQKVGNISKTTVHTIISKNDTDK